MSIDEPPVFTVRVEPTEKWGAFDLADAAMTAAFEYAMPCLVEAVSPEGDVLFTLDAKADLFVRDWWQG